MNSSRSSLNSFQQLCPFALYFQFQFHCQKRVLMMNDDCDNAFELGDRIVIAIAVVAKTIAVSTIIAKDFIITVADSDLHNFEESLYIIDL